MIQLQKITFEKNIFSISDRISNKTEMSNHIDIQTYFTHSVDLLIKEIISKNYNRF